MSSVGAGPSGRSTARGASEAAAGFGVAEQAGPDVPVVVGIVRSALSDGFTQAMLIATVLLAIGAINVGLRTPKIITAADDRLDIDPINEVAGQH